METYISKERLTELKSQLDELKKIRRKEIAQRIENAISLGDLSENADYHKAKEDQAFLEGRIQDLEYTLSRATIIDLSEKARDRVEVGAKVTVQILEEENPTVMYLLVGAKEADPRNGRISNESPVGKALLGSRVGDVVTAATPAGTIQYKIVRIE